MELFDLKEKQISSAIFQFILPCTLKAGCESALFTYLHAHHYEPFELNNSKQEELLYGGTHLSHKHMDLYFHPLIKQILFPPQGTIKSFQRLSKRVNEQAFYSSQLLQIAFKIHSVDVIICPYELVFLTIRTEMNDILLSDSIEFASSFQKTQEVSIHLEEKVFPTTSSFLFNGLLPEIVEFFKSEGLEIEKKEEIYVQSQLSFKEHEIIEDVDVYRSGSLDGLGPDGKPYIHVSNPDYIKNYLNQNSCVAWQPNRYYFSADVCFTLLTKEDKKMVSQLKEQTYGVIYYTLLLHLFYKYVFIKFLKEYSQLKIENDQNGVMKLIYMINSFTSNYFFLDHPFHSDGKELACLFRRSFNIDSLFSTTKDALFALFKYDENSVAKRDSLLLLILTLFTVICGIFSMNLFTHDLVGTIKWSHFKKYNPFETFAVIIVFSGLMATSILLVQSLYYGIKNRKSRKRWFRAFFLTSKSQKKS